MKVFVGMLSSMLIASCVSFGRSSGDTLGIHGHERLAEEHERSAAEHRRKALSYGGTICGTSSSFCPTGSVSPATTIEYEQATTDDHLAKEHRARIDELREDEREACGGVADRDGSAIPFGHVNVVQRMEKNGGVLEGVVVIATNDRGAPLDQVERVVQCRMARSAVRGLDGMELGACPFVPGARTSVRADGTNIAITITAPNDAVSKALDRCSPAARQVTERAGGA